MATANFTIAPDNTSNATFRAWITALFGAFATILTYVAQTGDLDPSTPSTPSAGDQKRGFRAYRFSDSAQATHPIFLRVDVGSGSAANQPGIWIQAGNTIDGSGNLGVVAGGNLMAQQQVTPNKTGTTSTSISQISGDGGRLTVNLFSTWMGTTEMPWFFAIERCPDSNGVYEDLAVGVDIISVSKLDCFTLTKNGRSISTKINSNSFMPWPFDDSATTATLGLRVGCFPPLRISQSRVYNGTTSLLIYHNGDYDGIGTELGSVYGSDVAYYMTQRGLAIITSASQVHRVAARND